MPKLNLRTYDGVALAGFLIIPPLFSTEASSLIKQNSGAAWISLLSSFIIMCCLFLVISPLVKEYEGKNFIEITSVVLGKPAGIVYGLALSVYFCFFTGFHVKESVEILKLYALEFTPAYAIIFLILLSAVIMNFFGAKAIVKSAGLFFIIILLGIIFIILLGLNRYNPDNLVPVLGNGFPEILKNGFLTASVFDSALILLLFAPAFLNHAGLIKSGILSIAVSALSYILFCLCFVMAFSPSVASKMLSGFIEMGKTSYYNRFFYRFESILLFFLIFSFVMLASIGLLVIKESVPFGAKLKTAKLFTVICSIPVLAATVIPSNILEVMDIYLPYVRRYSVFFMSGFPLLVLIINGAKRVLKYEKA